MQLFELWDYEEYAIRISLAFRLRVYIKEAASSVGRDFQETCYDVWNEPCMIRYNISALMYMCNKESITRYTFRKQVCQNCR